MTIVVMATLCKTQLFVFFFHHETHQHSWFLPDLSPQQLPNADENTPQPLVDGQSRAREGLPSKLDNDDLRRGTEAG